MRIEIEINGGPNGAGRYVSYAQSPCRVRATAGDYPREITLRSEALREGGGEVVFYAARDAAPAEELPLTLPTGGEWAELWVAGKWQRPSVEDGDCEISAWADDEKQEALPLMVRVRKNANGLDPTERDRFLHAFARLNDRGLGKFADFRAMHVAASDPQSHRGPHFLPWHRSYLLDLERELQAIDPSVSLHYWRWDEPAPFLFHEDFIGVSNEDKEVEFSPGHPLSTWITDGELGIRRRPFFDPRTSAAWFPNGSQRLAPRTQAQTLALGDVYADFRGMEGNPHGWAHVSFEGWISSIPTAAKDPLFFMLHSNVDRLWALWQWTHRHTDPNDADVYTGQDVDGRRLDDTLWPWNGVTGFPRPDFAPGGPMADSPTVSAPGQTPTIADMIDYQGRTSSPAQLGYGYDTVPYEPE